MPTAVRAALRRLIPASLTLLAAALLAAPAAAAPVGSGSLTWTMANVFDLAVAAPNDRTWLGFVTGPAPPLGGGSASPAGAAGGDTVTTASPRGRSALNSFTYPVASGSYDPASGRGAVELRGTVVFDTSGSPTGSFRITVTDPLVVLNGTQALALPPSGDMCSPTTPFIPPPPAHGQLFASGTDVGGQPYDRSQPILNLDLSAATSTDAPDGTRTISGIVPAVAVAQRPFPFCVNDGPRRDPDQFGALTLRIGPPAGPPPAQPPPPPAGPAAAPPPATVAGLRLTTFGRRPALGTTVSCPSGRPACTVTLLASHAGRRIASRVVVVGSGQARAVRLVLTPSAARRLRRSSVRRVRLKLVTRAAGGPAVESATNLALPTAPRPGG